MGKKCVLIVGGSGLLGSNLSKLYSNDFDVVTTYNKHFVDIKGCKCIQVDFCDAEQVRKLNVKPDVIINCIALTDLDYCEAHPEEAYNTNVNTLLELIKFAKLNDSYFIHISTDAVFDGQKDIYSETDATNPLNTYGTTKKVAEQIVLKSELHCCVIRTNFYGWNMIDKKSLAEFMLNNLENGRELKGFKDVVFTPILVNNLARAILDIIEMKYHGLIHIFGSETITKLGFAYKIAEVFELDSSLIRPVSVDSFCFNAKRAKKLGMDIELADLIVRTKLLGVEEGLREFKELRSNGYLVELKGGQN